MAKYNESESAHRHISKQYDHELLDIRSRVSAMGGLVEEQLANAATAVAERDAGLARQVIEDDDRVNDLEVSIDGECVQILALRQPAAGDLRLVVGVIKIVADLERIGDDAKRIAQHAIDLASCTEMPCPLELWIDLATHVRGLLRRSLDAFARMDLAAAVQVVNECRQMDTECERILRQKMDCIRSDVGCVQASLDIMWSTRLLERVAGRTSNICEVIIYYAKGKNICHASPEQVEKELLDG